MSRPRIAAPRRQRASTGPPLVIALVVSLLALLALVACSGDDGDDVGDDAALEESDDVRGGDTATTGAVVADEPSEVTAAPDIDTTLPLESDGAPQRIVADGDCACADGSEFSFWTRTRDPQKVVLFLAGGGACFSAATCDPSSATYGNRIDADVDPFRESGVFDTGDPRNPFADHSAVYVPYCTGDVHLGDATTEYSPELTVEHKGFVNGSAALDHLAEAFPGATEVVVMGESAGAIASPLYAGLLSDRLPDAEITVLADGAGAYPEAPLLSAVVGASWGVADVIPDWPETADLPPDQWSFPGLFVRAGLHDPDIVFARHDYAYDAVQAGFTALIGLGGTDLLTMIDANETVIEDAGVDLRSFIAPGFLHTVLRDPRFYTEEVDGHLLVDWVTGAVNREASTDVHCTDCQAG